MASVFLRKEMPYLFLLLIAILGFLATKIYDRVNALGILECSVHRKGNVETYVFKNLSKNSKVVKSRVFYVDMLMGIQNVTMRYIPPAVEPEIPKAPKKTSPNRWFVDFGDLGPSDSVEVTVVYAMCITGATIRFVSDNAVLFEFRSPLTIFYDNEFYVLFGLMGLALVLAVLYTILLSTQKGGTEK